MSGRSRRPGDSARHVQAPRCCRLAARGANEALPTEVVHASARPVGCARVANLAVLCRATVDRQEFAVFTEEELQMYSHAQTLPSSLSFLQAHPLGSNFTISKPYSVSFQAQKPPWQRAPPN